MQSLDVDCQEEEEDISNITQLFRGREHRQWCSSLHASSRSEHVAATDSQRWTTWERLERANFLFSFQHLSFFGWFSYVVIHLYAGQWLETHRDRQKECLNRNNRNVTFSTLPITELSDRRVTERTVAAINFIHYKNKPLGGWVGQKNCGKLQLFCMIDWRTLAANGRAILWPTRAGGEPFATVNHVEENSRCKSQRAIRKPGPSPLVAQTSPTTLQYGLAHDSAFPHTSPDLGCSIRHFTVVFAFAYIT